MSIQAVGWVLDHEDRTSGVTRLVLIALANYADEAGESYPGVPRIAANCRCSERAVQYAIGQLIELGIIERRLNAAADERIPGNKRPNVYRILGVQDLHPRRAQGRNPRPAGVQTTTPRGEPGFTQTVIGSVKEPGRTSEGDLFLPGSGVIGRPPSAYPDYSEAS